MFRTIIVRLAILAQLSITTIFFYPKSGPDPSLPHFFKIKSVNITGHKLLPIKDLEQGLNSLKGQNAIRVHKTKLMSQILSYGIIDQVNIDFDYRGTFNIHLQEHKPFAIWHNKGKYFLIDNKGVKLLKLKKTTDFENILLIFGNNLSGQIRVIAELIQNNIFLQENTISINFIAGRRWDLYLKNKIFLRLPAKNIADALQTCEKILTNRKYHGNIATLDLRLHPKKVFLTEHDKRKKNIRYP